MRGGQRVPPLQRCKLLTPDRYPLLFVNIDLDLSARLDDRILSLLQKTQWTKENDQRDRGPGFIIALFAFRRAQLQFLIVHRHRRLHADAERSAAAHHPGLFRLRNRAFHDRVFRDHHLTVNLNVLRDLEGDWITFSRGFTRYLINDDDSELCTVGYHLRMFWRRILTRNAGSNETDQHEQHHDSLKPIGGTDSFLHELVSWERELIVSAARKQRSELGE